MNTILVKSSFLFLFCTSLLVVGCKNKDDVDKSKAFVKYYGGVNMDNAVDVQQTEDGGYIIAGTSNTTGSPDMIIIKTNAEGNELWHATFGGPYYDKCASVAIMPDKGYMLLGTVGLSTTNWKIEDNSLTTADSTIMYAVRLDQFGTLMWEKTYPYSNPYVQVGTIGASIVANPNGECLFAGMVDSTYSSSVNLDLFAIIVDVDGNLKKVLNTATSALVDMKPLRYGTIDQNDIVHNAVRLNDNNEYVISTSTILSGQNTPRLVSCRLNGIALLHNNAPTKLDWAEPTLYQGGQINNSFDFNFAFTGYSKIDAASTSNYNMYLMKVSSSNYSKINIWNYGNSTEHKEIGVSVAPTTDGGYALLGITNNPDNTSSVNFEDVILLKLNDAGGVLWYRVFGGRGNDVATKVIQTTDGGYLVCGTIAFGDDLGTAGSSNELTLIKLDSEGLLNNVKE